MAASCGDACDLNASDIDAFDLDMDAAQDNGFIAIRVPDGDVVYVDKNELGSDWTDRVEDQGHSEHPATAPEDDHFQAGSDSSVSAAQADNRVTSKQSTQFRRAAVPPPPLLPRPIKPQRAYFYPGQEGCHSLPLKPVQKDDDVLSINDKQAISRVRLWLRAIFQAENDFADLLGVTPGDLKNMSLGEVLNLCDRWAKIKLSIRGVALPYMKMLLIEEYDSIILTLEKGLIRDPAIIVGSKGRKFDDLWEMPDRHDLNSGKGHYLIVCRNVLTGIAAGYGGAAFGIYGMIGRWTLVNGNHWLAAQKKDTGPVSIHPSPIDYLGVITS